MAHQRARPGRLNGHARAVSTGTPGPTQRARPARLNEPTRPDPSQRARPHAGAETSPTAPACQGPRASFRAERGFEPNHVAGASQSGRYPRPGRRTQTGRWRRGCNTRSDASQPRPPAPRTGPAGRELAHPTGWTRIRASRRLNDRSAPPVEPGRWTVFRVLTATLVASRRSSIPVTTCGRHLVPGRHRRPPSATCQRPLPAWPVRLLQQFAAVRPPPGSTATAPRLETHVLRPR
jgi:hypothetical protein